MSDFKEYKIADVDYNVQSAVDNLKQAYWSNEPEKVAEEFTKAEDIIISAICHFDYTVCKPSEIKEVERPQGEWIPIKTRPLTEEEKEEYPDCSFMYDCQMPEDEQEVIVSTKWGVRFDSYHKDVDGCYFEDYCEEDDVLAWMPFPQPYKEGGRQ